VHRFTGCFGGGGGGGPGTGGAVGVGGGGGGGGGGGSYQIHGGSTMELQLTLHVRYKNISPLIIAGLDGAGLQLVLPGHQT
jgi:hypothetical protein